MDLSELTAYASEKYQMQEQHKWADFPGFSVLCHPQTGKWAALLMRQWDTDTGTEIQCCDMKCGLGGLAGFRRPYLSGPVRMHGAKWVGITFDERTEPEVVFRLLDRAVAAGNPRVYTGPEKNGQGYTIVLDSRPQTGGQGYQETALPFAGSAYRPEKEKMPEQLRKMRRLYEYGRESAESKAGNFYRQAMFMQEYEDDYPWTGDFVCYFPTYHDLTTRQLRGYFSWRTRLRRGDFQPITASAAYIYIYELLNGVGAGTPEESLQKLREFEKGYLDAGFGDARMRANLRRWMLEFAVLRNLNQELARQAADLAIVERDGAIAVLKTPETHSDQEIFSALCFLGGRKTENSPVLAADRDRGLRLFGEAWRKASAYTCQGKDLFTLCFGKPQIRRWYPLSTAVYCKRDRAKDRDYALDESRIFHCRNGIWQVEAYEKLTFDRFRLQGFLHETDARLRRYLKTGRYLRENTADEWAVPYIDAVIGADREAVLEASRPRITIDLSGLEQIRREALLTQESLLTEEDRDMYPAEYEKEEDRSKAAEEAVNAAEKMTAEEAAAPAAEEAACSIPLDSVQIRILRALLEGRGASEIIRENHLMPTVMADAINEAFFDEIGDTVVCCEDETLTLVEDYTEEIAHCLGGTTDG